MVLSLVMCSINNASAQEKEYIVEKDGFEWYRISKFENLTMYYGAQDKFGNTILPTKYPGGIFYSNGFFEVYSKSSDYLNSSSLLDLQGNLIVPEGYYRILVLGEGQMKWIYVRDKNNHEGAYNIYGKCVVPVSRNYVRVSQFGSENGEKGVYFLCQHTGGYYEYSIFSICDASGKVVFTTSKEYRSICLMRDNSSGKFALAVLTDHWYFVNLKEQTLWNPQCYTIQGSEFKIQKSKDGALRNITPQEKNRILFSADLLKGNTEYFAHASEQPMQRARQNDGVSGGGTAQQQSGPQQSGGATTTIVVEHHRDPVPVQQWQACWACGGMGTMGCDGCGGSGTKYYGNSLRICSRCNGQGLIPCNVCFGNKGQYTTVYR